MALKTGIYSLEFNNTYSWFNSKEIRFRLNVLDSLNVICDETKPLRNILFPNLDEAVKKIRDHNSKDSLNSIKI
jgi:hypothetical protein